MPPSRWERESCSIPVLSFLLIQNSNRNSRKSKSDKQEHCLSHVHSSFLTQTATSQRLHPSPTRHHVGIRHHHRGGPSPVVSQGRRPPVPLRCVPCWTAGGGAPDAGDQVPSLRADAREDRLSEDRDAEAYAQGQRDSLKPSWLDTNWQAWRYHAPKFINQRRRALKPQLRKRDRPGKQKNGPHAKRLFCCYPVAMALYCLASAVDVRKRLQADRHGLGMDIAENTFDKLDGRSAQPVLGGERTPRKTSWRSGRW